MFIKIVKAIGVILWTIITLPFETAALIIMLIVGIIGAVQKTVPFKDTFNGICRLLTNATKDRITWILA